MDKKSMWEIALVRQSRRSIPLAEIAELAGIAIDKVEEFVVEALDSNEIKGEIDQVERVVHVTWVQSRQLSAAQIVSMADRLGQWRAQLEQIMDLIKKGETSETATTAEDVDG